MTDFNIHREIDSIFSEHLGTGHRPDPIAQVVTDSPLPEAEESPSTYYARLARSTHADLVSDGANTHALEELMVYMALSIKNRLAEGVWDEAIDTIRRIKA